MLGVGEFLLLVGGCSVLAVLQAAVAAVLIDRLAVGFHKPQTSVVVSHPRC
jgi:hypothetical protein